MMSTRQYLRRIEETARKRRAYQSIESPLTLEEAQRRADAIINNPDVSIDPDWKAYEKYIGRVVELTPDAPPKKVIVPTKVETPNSILYRDLSIAGVGLITLVIQLFGQAEPDTTLLAISGALIGFPAFLHEQSRQLAVFVLVVAGLLASIVEVHHVDKMQADQINKRRAYVECLSTNRNSIITATVTHKPYKLVDCNRKFKVIE